MAKWTLQRELWNWMAQQAASLNKGCPVAEVPIIGDPSLTKATCSLRKSDAGRCPVAQSRPSSCVICGAQKS